MEIVSLEIAQKLKEKGFEIPTKDIIAMYNELGEFHTLTTSADYVKCTNGSKHRCYYNYDDFDEYDYVAPTISQVLKWLREEKKIYIMINFWPGGYCAEIFTEIGKDRNSFCWEKYIDECDYYDTYEQAAIAGVEYTLDNLI